MKGFGRRLLPLCLVGCLLGNLTGCSSEPREESPPVTLTWYINYSWFDKSWGLDAVSQYITQETGVYVEYIIPSGDETQQVQRYLTQGLTADIITLDAWDSTYLEFLAKGLLSPLDVLAEEYNTPFMEYTNEDSVHWYTYNDHLYLYPNASYPIDTNQGYSNQTFLVRKDIYEGIGSPDMTTPEGFLQALEDAVAYCPTVEGYPLIPLGLQEFTQSGNHSLEDYLQNFLAIPYEENGQVVDRLTHPDSLLWLQTFNEANRRGLLAQDIFLDKRIQMEEKIAEGRYFAMLYQWSDCSEQLQELYTTDPDRCYIAVDGPKNTVGDDHTLAGSNIQGWTVTGVSATSPNQEAAISLLSYLMSDEGQRLLFLGVEGDGYIMEDGVPLLTPDAALLLEENRGEYDKIYGGATTHWPMMNNLYADQMGYVFPDNPPFDAIKEWSAPYTENFSLYAYQEFAYDTPAYQAKMADDAAKGTLLVSLLLAETPGDFDSLWEGYLAGRQDYYYNAVLSARQHQLESNKERLE